MDDCIFCKIVEGEIKSEKIYETENIISFLDANPRSPGHSLVIPKEHVERFWQLEDQIIGELFTGVKSVEKMLKCSLDPDAFTIGINDGRAAGQEIPHMHVNVMPRFLRDGGSTIHAVVNNPPEKEIPEIAEEIRKSPQGPAKNKK